MIEQLKTNPAILNKEKLKIRATFFTPWSSTLDMNLGEYTKIIDKRQRAAKN